MPQTSFKFKQFNILNKNCAMPVGTDAVLLGSWAECPVNASVLDIGSGSGLISLMMAQRFETAQITGIEIHKESYDESLMNIENSPWSDRISVLNEDIQTHLLAENRYDLIISNPPFFEKTTLTGGAFMARDSASMPMNVLSSSARLLTPNGCMTVIGPVEYMESLQKMVSEEGLFIQRQLLISGTMNSTIKRIISEFGRKECDVHSEHLVIEPYNRHEYSSRYKELTEAFYLD